MGNRLSNAQIQMLATPDGFAEGILGMRLYRKQREVLRSMLPEGAAVTFKSCNEGGKTSRVLAALILWHLWVFPRGRIITTSGSFQQIENQLGPALKQHESKFPAWKFRQTPGIDTDHPNCFWRGISVKESGRFEGHHEDKDVDAPLLIAVDEAKTVQDAIFEAIDRCKPTRLLLASSPGFPEGEFYRSHTSRAQYYKTISQTAQECPHITPEWIDRMIAKWGKDHPLVRSMIFAEFMEMTEDAIFSLKALDELLADPPAFNRAENGRKAFCDFAAGGDENVLALREGNRVKIVKAWRELDTMKAVGQFIECFVREGLQPHEIEADEGGLGKPMCDALASAGWQVNRGNNQGKPRTDAHFQNYGAETWFTGARMVERKEIILPENDNDLRGQLISRKKKPVAGGKLGIESKEDMRKRGLPSPDRADAVLGALTPFPGIGGDQADEDPLFDEFFGLPTEHHERFPGFNPGSA